MAAAAEESSAAAEEESLQHMNRANTNLSGFVWPPEPIFSYVKVGIKVYAMGFTLKEASSSGFLRGKRCHN